ncbi:MAG: hypothetical protein SPL59_02000 [Catonella sp.]|nr:hypothetical protein [Catonella sp.]
MIGDFSLFNTWNGKIMREIIDKYKNDPLFKKKLFLSFIGVFFMGFFLAFLRKADLGTDPYTFMNVTVVGKINANRQIILFGTWQLILNIIMLVIGWFWKKTLIGPGTVINMVGVGYVSDLFYFITSKTIPDAVFTTFPQRAIIFAVALFGFAIAAAVYMSADCGLSPYDLLCNQTGFSIKKVPFAITRICCDFIPIIVGVLLGGKLNIGTVFIGLALGPAIQAVGKFMNEHILKMDEQ